MVESRDPDLTATICSFLKYIWVTFQSHHPHWTVLVSAQLGRLYHLECDGVPYPSFALSRNRRRSCMGSNSILLYCGITRPLSPRSSNIIRICISTEELWVVFIDVLDLVPNFLSYLSYPHHWLRVWDKYVFSATTTKTLHPHPTSNMIACFKAINFQKSPWLA